MGKKPATDAPAAADDRPRVRFSYIKAQSHRVIHADGVFGGVTPRGEAIAISFFNERVPIPREVVHSIADDGSLGEEIREERVAREGIVREVDATVLIDAKAAKQLQDWLGEKLKQIETVQRALAEAAAPRQKKAGQRKRKKAAMKKRSK